MQFLLLEGIERLETTIIGNAVVGHRLRGSEKEEEVAQSREIVVADEELIRMGLGEDEARLAKVPEDPVMLASVGPVGSAEVALVGF